MSATVRVMARQGARHTDTVIIGAGHSGLAMSRCLATLGIDHVVLERGDIANSWRHERWDSLRLLTPNWQTRLPGFGYDGSDPHGFMTMPELIAFIDAYAARISAPVRSATTVGSIRREADGYRVHTDHGEWQCRSVVIASGACAVAQVPAVDQAVPAGITRVTPHTYRNPELLEQGGVLVVGASASGLQLAEEIHRSGRPVTLAVGEHVRMPRTYRGMDIQWWMDAAGILDQRYDEIDDIERARRVPSPQLTGRMGGGNLDLNALSERGVRLVGRLVGIRDGRAQFSGALHNHCAMADMKMNRLLKTIDEWACQSGLAHGTEAGEHYLPTRIERSPCLELNLEDHDIRTIVWACGFRPDYSWLHVPVLDRRGQIRHDGGVVQDAPGLYLMGLGFMRRRKSSFIHGAEDDALDLSAHLANYLRRDRMRRAFAVGGW